MAFAWSVSLASCLMLAFVQGHLGWANITSERPFSESVRESFGGQASEQFMKLMAAASGSLGPGSRGGGGPTGGR